MTGWHYGPMLGFDIESTGTDVEQDRIVTAALVWVHGPKVELQSWLINPGVPIPEGATAIHGITDEMAAEGDSPADVLPIIAAAIMDYLDQQLPVVAFNACFDLTMLDRELRRHMAGSVEPAGYALMDPADVRPVIDPFVIDRALDKYRKGKRTLDVMCKHYRVPFEGEGHTADADAFATLRLAWRLAEVWNLGDMDLAELTDKQAGWHRERQEDYAAYLRREGKDDSEVNASWPIIPRPHLVSR